MQIETLVPLVNARILQRLIPHSQLFVFHDGHLGLMIKARELGPIIEQFLA